MSFKSVHPGCPIGCKYCMVTYINVRRNQWQKKHRWGINKTLLFLNKLPGELPIKELNIDPMLLAGEYVGFQGITDPFWPIFTEDLKYMVELTCKTQIRKLVLVTKWPITKEQIKIIQDNKKILLIVSITGLDVIENTSTQDRLRVIELALNKQISIIPLIHPYIHKVSNLSFLTDLKKIGVNKVSIKGFRYNDQWMGKWARQLIPEDVRTIYTANQEQEIMVGNEYIKEMLHTAGLTNITFREWVHKPSGNFGVNYDDAKKAIDKLMPYCVVSSSDPENVYKMAIERRLV